MTKFSYSGDILGNYQGAKLNRAKFFFSDFRQSALPSVVCVLLQTVPSPQKYLLKYKKPAFTGGVGLINFKLFNNLV